MTEEEVKAQFARLSGVLRKAIAEDSEPTEAERMQAADAFVVLLGGLFANIAKIAASAGHSAGALTELQLWERNRHQ